MNDATDATSLLNCFAMSTEKEHPTMGELRQKDLCLLQSLRYTSPEKKASQIIKNELESEFGAFKPILEDVNFGMQTNPQEASLCSLYYATRLLCDAIHVFCSKNIQTGFLACKEKQKPIGMRLLFLRSDHLIAADASRYIIQLQETADLLMPYLLQSKRYHPAKKQMPTRPTVGEVTSNPINENRINENAAASPEQTIEKDKIKSQKKKKKYCCAIWCSESDQTQDQTRVPVLPLELPKNASRRRQIT